MGVLMAEVGSRGFVVGIVGMLFTGIIGGALVHSVKEKNPDAAGGDPIRHIAETADLSTPLSLEDVAAYFGIAFGLSFAISIVCMYIMAKNQDYYRW
jgi:ABC-type lipoprotein release transport system permease subunit